MLLFWVHQNIHKVNQFLCLLVLFWVLRCSSASRSSRTGMPEEKAEANVTSHIYERLFLWHAYQILQWESLRIVPETVSPGALKIDSIDHGNASSYETGPVTPISCCWVCINPEPGISGTKLSKSNWNESVFNTLIRLSRKNNPALFFRVKMSAKGYLISPRDKSRCVAAIPLRVWRCH